MAGRVSPRSTPAENLRIVLRAIPWRLLLLLPVLLVLAFPAFLFGTSTGQRLLPALTNYFYNLSGPPASPLQPLPTPLINVAQQKLGIDCSNGCNLTVRIAPQVQVQMLVQTTLPVRTGSWIWAQAMFPRKPIKGFDNYPYADPTASLNGATMRVCDLQLDGTHDDNSLSCSQLLPNTIIDDGGAWLFGVTGPGSLDHWRYPLHVAAGTRVLL